MADLDPVARARAIAARLAATALPGDTLGKRKSRWEVRLLLSFCVAFSLLVDVKLTVKARLSLGRRHGRRTRSRASGRPQAQESVHSCGQVPGYQLHGCVCCCYNISTAFKETVANGRR